MLICSAVSNRLLIVLKRLDFWVVGEPGIGVRTIHGKEFGRVGGGGPRIWPEHNFLWCSAKFVKRGRDHKLGWGQGFPH